MKSIIVQLALCLLAVACLLFGIRQSQFRPHRVTYYLDGQVVSTFMVTNPMYVKWTSHWETSSNGLQLVNTPETNYYWQQWSIFR